MGAPAEAAGAAPAARSGGADAQIRVPGAVAPAACAGACSGPAGSATAGRPPRVPAPTGASGPRLKPGRLFSRCLALLILCTAVWSAGPPPLPAQSPGSVTAAPVTGPPYPPATDWRQLRLPHHRVIYPEGAEDTARRAAAQAHEAWSLVQRDLDVTVAPLPLIINTRYRVSNGYFAIPPRRSEWYGYNSQLQFAGPVDWYLLLALHEGRHAAQFTALDTGFTRVARWAAGETGWGFIAYYSMPLWFFEGDAIMAETLYSAAGRGRSASFHRELRPFFGADPELSYSQAYLGSFRSRYPNHYYLGFTLVAYIRLVYGQETWNEIIRRTSLFSFWPLRFHIVVKQETGRSVERLYEDAHHYFGRYFDRLDREAQTGPEGRPTVLRREAERIGPLPADGWVNYLPAGLDPQGRLFLLRYGDRYADELVRVDPGGPGGGSSEVRRLGRIAAADRHISVSGETAVWVEQVPHPLWSKVSSRDIFTVGLTEGGLRGRRRVTRGGAYHAPSLSPDGSKIAAVQGLAGGGAQLHIVSAQTGEVLQVLGGGPGVFYLQPAWSPGGSFVAAVRVEDGTSSLMEYELAAGSARAVSGPVEHTISDPRYMGRYIVYVSERFGKEELAAAERESGARYRIFSPRYGADSPLPDPEKGRLYIADYGAGGFTPLRLSWTDPEVSARFGPDAGGGIGYVDEIERTGAERAGEAADGSPASGPAYESPSEPYLPAGDALNVHSWGALPTGDGRVEAFVQADDYLGLYSLRAYTGFAPARGRYDAGLEGTYRGIFPLLRFGLSGDTAYPANPQRSWSGTTAYLGFLAPFDLSRGLWRRSLTLGSTAFLRYQQAVPDVRGDTEDTVVPLSHRASFYNASRAAAPVDFAPPFAQYLELTWMHMPLKLELDGRRLAGRGFLTFPGILPRHRLNLSAAAEWKEGDEVPLTYPLLRPRGYPYGWNEDYDSDLVAGVEYALPLLSPDLELGHLYYLKRIRLALFTEVGFGLPTGASEPGVPEYLEEWEERVGARLHPASGAELVFEQHLFSWPIELEAGLRIVYRWRDEVYRLEDTVLTLGVEW